ncbi:BrnT family toxin [Wenzhouxiangella sp. XN24]|uniref:BrnT family toxin n=1 Tax=Wenzhouxiangella sp. XN24 TaxID=2713569 RepID=UPI0013EA9518|nr:BrnT family toxin [Wenzhouxiangella sp. XN24]NGX17733.1 BrnT family toxin [Wenzhouxiangella sp. XN24]
MVACFEWDSGKDAENQQKHGVGFSLAQEAFLDPKRVIARDLAHSESEERFYCFGSVGGAVLTVRFAYRNNAIRIIGAGYWRKGKRIYERENQIHQ